MAANIKVKYQSTVRRLTIPNATTNSWIDFETQLRTLFSIPETNPISVSYTDEDGDVITLSSDLELYEVISNNNKSPFKTLSFVLSTVNDSDHSTKNPENDSWVLEGNVSPYIIDKKVDVEEKQETEATVTGESEDSDKLTNNNDDSKESSDDEESLRNASLPDNSIHHLHTTITDETDEPEFAPTITTEENNTETIKDKANESNNDNSSKGKQKQISIEEPTASNDETSKKEENDWFKIFYNITAEQSTNSDSEKNATNDSKNAESSSTGARRILLKISSQPTQNQFSFVTDPLHHFFILETIAIIAIKIHVLVIVLPIAAVVVPTFFLVHFLNKITTRSFHRACDNRCFLERQQRLCGNRYNEGYNREAPVFFYRRHH
ncbi:1033_t:CDS:2 [Ambispora gerdemannii]|uniref:1033_t:CDS:1 n=1 Tax=Ambispora gerdemannii TaxID=144530 RepID=A0A9N8Z3U7_9GLOM|nr:1033_t:CDS:2 [Ambispora gerdemannii]